jgi:16S rRNA (adenine1518-N6/adenine1519-N6)-dimethyltransferase
MGARREARAALAAAGLRPQRRFGQNFLVDPAVAARIVETAHAMAPGAPMLEIGPGLGALTEALAARPAPLWLVELDRGLAARLRERFAADAARVHVLEGDATTLPLDALVTDADVTVVGNLPYNVSTPILFRLLALRARFPRAVLMLQREVALRLASRPGTGDWGVLPVLVQTFADVRVAFGVSRRSFHPVPKVDSAVVAVRWSAGPRVDVGDVERHRAVVRAAFGQRRKMLRNALAALAATRGRDLDAVLARAGVVASARAETLTLDDFARLARAFDEDR